jgi:hypothetical protein
LTVATTVRVKSKPLLLKCPATHAVHLDLTVPKKLPAFAVPFAKKYRHLFVKDVLRVGDWHTEGGTWQVRRKELSQLVSAAADYEKAKNSQINLTWDHSNSARDIAGDICLTFLTPGSDGNELSMLIGTNDEETAKALDNGVAVSLQVTPRAEDGDGNKYPILATHLALCQRPVVTGQRPAVRLLSQTGKKAMKISERLRTWIRGEAPINLADNPFGKKEDEPAEDDEPEETEDEPETAASTAGDDAEEMPVKDIVMLLNETYDAGLSESITTVGELKRHLETLDNQASEDEPEGDEEGGAASSPVQLDDAATAGLGGGGMYNQRTGGKPVELTAIRKQLAAQGQQISALTAELTAANKRNQIIEAAAKASRIEARKTAKASFELSLNGLAERGRVTPQLKDRLMLVGKAGAWDLALLSPYDDGRMIVPTVRLSQHTASADPPPMNLSARVYTPEETKKLAETARQGILKGQILAK